MKVPESTAMEHLAIHREILTQHTGCHKRIEEKNEINRSSCESEQGGKQIVIWAKGPEISPKA